MAQNYQLCLIVLIVVFLSQSPCLSQFIPGTDTPEQFFVIEGLGDGGTLGAGAETGIVGNTGPDLSALAALFPFLLLAPLILAATAPAATAAPAPAVPAPAAPAPAAPGPSVTTTLASTTTCVLQCPAMYMRLADTTISPNCYLGSGSSVIWLEALANCLQTPGAYLWIPNSAAEADAVRSKLSIGNSNVWTGANDIATEGVFSFIVENSGFSLNAPPFGTAVQSTTANTDDCVTIQFPNTANPQYRWEDLNCGNRYIYVCEIPPTCS
ncbi:tetranectin-like [Mytilus californianus]|uniref:tetranectin-like n=1 Tax=Mytilus californianus TaxID=6549 RepID=UPI0022455E26|nr:tetranectin-like [Mytilus californianus]